MSFDFFDAAITLEPAPPPIGLVAPEGELLVLPAETPSRAVLLMADEREDVAFDDLAIVDQFALMPTGRDMVLAGSALGTAGDPALMEFLWGQRGGADLGTRLAGFSLFGPDAVSAASAITLMEQSGECGCSGNATHHSDRAELQNIETPAAKRDPAFDPQFGYVDNGNGTGYDDANGNGQWDSEEDMFIIGSLETEDRLVPTWDLWLTDGSGSGDSGGGGGTTIDNDECGQDDVPPWTNPLPSSGDTISNYTRSWDTISN